MLPKTRSQQRSVRVKEKISPKNEKNKGGRPRVFDRDNLRNIFETHSHQIIVHETNKVRVPSDKIYAKIKADYDVPMTPKAIYTEAQRWYAEKLNTEQKECESFNESLETHQSESLLSEDGGSINFCITLSVDEWSEIEPDEVTYNRNDITHDTTKRDYLVLKADVWTEMLINKIADHPQNIICDIAFKRSKVTPDGENYAYVFGYCKTCEATLHGYIEEYPEPENSVDFKFNLVSYNENRHRESRNNVKVTGSQAKKLALSKTPAVVLHRELASKSGEMFVQPKGRNPSANAIRNLQSRNRQKNRLSNDVFTSLQLMRYSVRYQNEIHQISMQPFGLIYGSPNQFLLYNMHKKQNPVVKVYCDATGGLVRKIGMLRVINNMNQLHIFNNFSKHFSSSTRWKSIGTNSPLFNCYFKTIRIPNSCFFDAF